MTKIRKSRRGFTLLEIVIVVAIIVIVAGAAFLGVTVTLTRANDARNQLKENNGDNFEVDARNEIEHLKADPNFTPIQEYTPEGETDEDDEDDDDEDDGEDEEENGGDPVNNQSGNKNSPTPTPTNTPTPTPTDTNTNTPTPKPTNTPTPKPTNSTNPHVANTYTGTDSSNAQGSNVTGNPSVSHDYYDTWYWTEERGSWSERTYTNTKIQTSGSISASGNRIEEVILTVPSGTTSITVDNWKYSVEQIDDTHYRIWYDAPSRNQDGDKNYIYNPPETSINYRVNEEYSDPNITQGSGVVISEYSTSQ